MALKAIVDNLDGLAEDVAKEYKQREDAKYVLDVMSVDGLELAEVSKLQSALSKERENSRKATEQLKAFDGLDPTKAREALKKLEEMATWTPEQKVKEQIETVKASIIEAHAKEKAALQEKVEKLTKSLQEEMITSVVSQEVAKQKGNVRLLMPHIQKQTRLRDADGKFISEVLDTDGNPRVYGSDGHPMSIGELVAEMKTQDDFASAFEGTGATGSGATGSNTQRTGGRANLEELAKLPPAQRMQRAQELGIKT